MYRGAQTTTLLRGEGEGGKLRQIVLIVLRILSSIVVANFRVLKTEGDREQREINDTSLEV